MCLCYLAGAIDMIQDRKDGDITKTWKAKAKEDTTRHQQKQFDKYLFFH